MLNFGKRLIWGLVLVIIFSPPVSSQSYYLCSYDAPDSSIPDQISNIIVNKIDIPTLRISQIGSFPLDGGIEFRTPLVINRNQQGYLFISAMAGWGGKNSTMSNDIGTNFVVIDTLGNLIKSGKLNGYHLYGFLGYDTSGPIIKYSYNDGEIRRKMLGTLQLMPNDSISLMPLGREPIMDDYPEIGPFHNYNRVNLNNNQIQWSVVNRNLYLLSFNTTHALLLDSLRIASNLYYSHLLQMSLNDSLIYVFYINCNRVGGSPNNQKITIDPSYLIKYHFPDLTSIDTINVPYPQLDSGYVSCERGRCDWVGPYLVYYFFQGEDQGYFSPAMLFIFDTRTNEARWLRVGWR